MPNVSRGDVCREDGCDKPIHGKHMCAKHYRRWYRARNADKIAAYYARPDVRVRRRQNDKRRQTQKRRVYQRAWRDARKDWGDWWERQRVEEDVADLDDWASRQKRRQRRIERATRPSRPTRQFIMGWCPDCGKPNIVVRGWWHDSIRHRQCTLRRWRLNHIERAKDNGVEWEHISSITIFKRDGYRCQICGRKTRGKWPAPTSSTIDHIIPLSKGGPHLEHNLQTACLRCNIKKGTGTANDQLRLAV